MYDGNGSIVGFKYNNNVYYYQKNLQGDVVSIVDKNLSVVVKYVYNAYGLIESTTGSMANTLGKVNPIRYRGYYYDEESRYYYLNSRYYNPQIGKFINADVLISTGQGYLGYNMFAYCLNNPVNRADYGGNTSILLTYIENISYAKSILSIACSLITFIKNLPITNKLIQNAIYYTHDIYINCDNNNDIVKAILAVEEFINDIDEYIKKCGEDEVS